MKKNVALFLIAALLLGLSAPSSAKGRKFGASLMGMDSPYFTAMANTLKAIVEYNDDTLLLLDPARDQAKQNSQIREMIDQGVAAVFLAPVDCRGVKESLEACKAAGVHIVNLDSPVQDEELVDCIVCSNNTDIGRLCAEDLLKQLWGGKIAVLGNSATRTWQERLDKFEELVNATPGFIIAVKEDFGGGRRPAMEIATEMIRKTRDIDAIFCNSDVTALGVIEALVEAGKLKDVLVYGTNGSPEAKKAIQSSKLAGTAAQSPITIARIGCEAAFDILDGKAVKKRVQIPVLFINAENLGEFYVDGWQ